MKIDLYKHPAWKQFGPTWIVIVEEHDLLLEYHLNCDEPLEYKNQAPHYPAYTSSYLEFLVVLGKTKQDIQRDINDHLQSG